MELLIFAPSVFILFVTVIFSKEFLPFGKRTTTGFVFGFKGDKGLLYLFKSFLRPEAIWTNFLKASDLCALFIAVDHGRNTLFRSLFELIMLGRGCGLFQGFLLNITI